MKIFPTGAIRRVYRRADRLYQKKTGNSRKSRTGRHCYALEARWDNAQAGRLSVVRSGKFLHSRGLDWPFVIFAPLLAFALVALACEPRLPGRSLIYNPAAPHWLYLVAAHCTFAHLVFVFCRSHLNHNIFRMYPRRFVIGPILIFVALLMHDWIFLAAAAIAVQWDEVHSVMQTFGLGRLYDRQLGAIRPGDRLWDLAFCFAFQLFPYTAMLTYLPSDGVLEVLEIEDADLYFAPDVLLYIRYALFAFMGVVGTGYVARQIFARLRGGSAGSLNKLLLYGATGASTLLVVSNYTFFEASIVGNLYHAVQYFFVILVFEKGNLSQVFGWFQKRLGYVAIGTALLLVALFSAQARILTEQFPGFLQFWLTISLTHFWFDGFIWSIRRGQV